jgi:hypothetical protein
MRYRVEGREDHMDWIIQSRGEITRGISESPRYTTYDGFLVALRDLFGDPKRQFVSATLSGGTVLNEADAKALLGEGFAIGVSPIGQTPLG